MEARLIVMLKGGEWAAPESKKPVANAIAVRGLDFEKGLKENWNKTYDDTMYLVLETATGPAEVYEYRMTTESSSESKGVGRLESKQVTYVRGKHRGTDPGYRLQGNAAPGTRVGIKGAQQITGANIHSAYSKRPINSETPLQPNVSLGCQVVAASKQDFEKSLVQTLDQRGVKQFLYTIVDDAELAELNKILESQGVKSVLASAVSRCCGAPGSRGLRKHRSCGTGALEVGLEESFMHASLARYSPAGGIPWRLAKTTLRMFCSPDSKLMGGPSESY